MATLFGIKNCDTVKKARRWLDNNSISYQFHDFRADGLDSQRLNTWLASTDLATLVNKRSTTWKSLSDEQKQTITDSEGANKAVLDLLIEHPTLIKRPVLSIDDRVEVGFKEATYAGIFN